MSEPKHYAAYDADGRIFISISADPEFAEKMIHDNGGTDYIETPFRAITEEHYIEGGELKARPEPTMEIDGDLLKGVPAGSNIHIENSVYVADGTDITLSFSYPGVYRIKVKPWPMKEWEVEYTQL